MTSNRSAATRPLPHILVTGCISAAAYAYYGSPTASLWAFAGGVLIDLDHLPEFFMEYRPRDIMKFFDVVTYSKLKRFILFMHSWELVALLWAAISLFSLGPSPIAFTTALSVHLVMDAAYNPINSKGYIFTYRALNRFKPDNIIVKEKLRKERK